jgi:hypothetical protein
MMRSSLCKCRAQAFFKLPGGRSPPGRPAGGRHGDSDASSLAYRDAITGTTTVLVKQRDSLGLERTQNRPSLSPYLPRKFIRNLS